jgi:hypothetical protein
MYVMSVLGTIVTSALVGSISGIGGAILGAWMNGRSQMAGLHVSILADNQRARTAEKRRIYGRCLAALNDASVQSASGRLLPTGVHHIFEQIEQHKLLIQQCMNVVYEVALIAPQELGQLAIRAATGIGTSRFGTAMADLMEAMRADLGEPALGSGEESQGVGEEPAAPGSDPAGPEAEPPAKTTFDRA